MEYHDPATEYASSAREYSFPTEDTSPREFYEYVPAEQPRSGSGDRHSLIKKLMTLPVAASVAALSIIFAAQGVDPLGADVFGDDKSSYSDPKASGVFIPDPEEGEEIVVHVKYVPTAVETVISGLSKGSEYMYEMDQWVIEQGGDPDTVYQVDFSKTYTGYEVSDGGIFVGDEDDLDNAYVLGGTLIKKYRLDYYFEAYASSWGSTVSTPVPSYSDSSDGIVEAPKDNETVIIHLRYTYPDGRTTVHYSVSAYGGAEALKESKEWLAGEGGDPNTVKFVDKTVTYVGPEGSDTILIVPDLVGHFQPFEIAMPCKEYRVDYYFEGFTATGNSDVPSEDTEDIPFPELDNPDPDFVGNYAWSTYGSEEYLKVYPDAVDSTKVVYLVMGGAWEYMEGGTSLLGTVDGAGYDRDTNTLTLNNFHGGALDMNLMGNGFTIRLIGDNSLNFLSLWGAMYGGSVTFTGDGSLTINNPNDGEAGILIRAENSNSCLMVDSKVTLDISADVPVAIYDTGLPTSVYWRGNLDMGGGAVSTTEVDGSGSPAYYNSVIANSDHAVFSPK